MTQKKVITCHNQATEYLCRQDAALGEHIRRLGIIERELTPDLFEALTSSIISQQISGAAAETIGRRLKELVGDINPKNVLNYTVEEMRACGISARKASYIQAAAKAVHEGAVSIDNIPAMEDEDIIVMLDALPGIGRWTAEMMLIFSLSRPDILSYDDLGIRRGIMRIHNLTTLSREEFRHYRDLYSPYGTTASIYLWQIASEIK